MSRMSGTFGSIAARRFDSKPIRYSFSCSRLPVCVYACNPRGCRSRLHPHPLEATLSATSDSLHVHRCTSPICIRFPVFRQFVSTISCARVWKFCLFGDWGKGRYRARCEEQTRTKGGKIEERVGKIEKNFRSIGSILFLSNLDVYCIRLMILLYTGDIARSPSYWPNSTCRSFSHLLSIRFYLFLFFSILLPLPR